MGVHDRTHSIKTLRHMEKITSFLDANNGSRTIDIANMLGLSPARTRALLSEMPNVQAVGDYGDRRYYLKKWALLENIKQWISDYFGQGIVCGVKMHSLYIQYDV